MRIRTRVGPRGNYKGGMTRLADGKLLAALRRDILNEGFEVTVVTRSDDNGETWSRPAPLTRTGEVHCYLTKLSDGRILATYANYHLPYGVCAIVSADGGRMWDCEHPVQLSVSADIYEGWPVTLELPGGDLVTSYANSSYMEGTYRDKMSFDVVRWQLPTC